MREQVLGWVVYGVLGLFVISVSAIVLSTLMGLPTRNAAVPLKHQVQHSQTGGGRLQPHVSASEMTKRVLERHHIEVVCSNSFGGISSSVAQTCGLHDESLWFLHDLLSCPTSVCSWNQLSPLRLVLVNRNSLENHPELESGSQQQQILLPIDAASNATQLVPSVLQVYDSIRCLRAKLQCRAVRSHSTPLNQIAKMVSSLANDPALVSLPRKFDLSLVDFEFVNADGAVSRPAVAARAWKSDTVVLTQNAHASDIDKFLMVYV
jgi:hypothetical protein